MVFLHGILVLTSLAKLRRPRSVGLGHGLQSPRRCRCIRIFVEDGLVTCGSLPVVPILF